MTLYYTGVGSRHLPTSYYRIIHELAVLCSVSNYTLRSGGADGCDAIFESGSGNSEIYLPWKGYNNHNSPLYETPDEMFHIASRLAGPAWSNFKQSTRKLIARNMCQITGYIPLPLNYSKFVICYTPDGAETIDECSYDTGGTRWAIMYANYLNIPIFNIKNGNDTIYKLFDFMQQVTE